MFIAHSPTEKRRHKGSIAVLVASCLSLCLDVESAHSLSLSLPDARRRARRLFVLSVVLTGVMSQMSSDARANSQLGLSTKFDGPVVFCISSVPWVIHVERKDPLSQVDRHLKN